MHNFIIFIDFYFVVQRNVFFCFIFGGKIKISVVGDGYVLKLLIKKNVCFKPAFIPPETVDQRFHFATMIMFQFNSLENNIEVERQLTFLYCICRCCNKTSYKTIRRRQILQTWSHDHIHEHKTSFNIYAFLYFIFSSFKQKEREKWSWINLINYKVRKNWSEWRVKLFHYTIFVLDSVFLFVISLILFILLLSYSLIYMGHIKSTSIPKIYIGIF